MRGEIVVVTRSLPHHQLGGMEIAAWDLSKAFARLGYAVRVLTTAIPGQSQHFEESGVSVVALAGTPSARYSRIWRDALCAYFARNCLDSTQAVLSVSAGAFGLLRFKRQRPGIVFAMQAHGTSWGEVVSKWRNPPSLPRALAGSLKNLVNVPKDMAAYRRFDLLIGVGPRVCRDLKGSPLGWFIPSARVQQIDNGIDTDVFYPGVGDRQDTRLEFGIPDEAEVVVSACRLHAQKGVDTSLRALAELCRRRSNVVGVIAGDGPERASLEALSDRLGITERIVFTGVLSRTSLARLYRASDVFLFLSRRVEGLPLNTLEALASGLPCVIAEHLVPANVTDGMASCAANDVAAAAQKLEEQLVAATQATRRSHLPLQYSLEFSAQRYIEACCCAGLSKTQRND